MSETTPKTITGLKTGETYTLREVVAPDGYTLTTDTKFELNPDIKDFYQFTTDDITITDYVTGPQIKDIPIAI